MRPVTTIYTRGLRLSSGLNPYTRRHLHATPWVAKSVKEKISDVADKVWFILPDLRFKMCNLEQVNKKVGEGLASGIETGEKATEKTKKTLGKRNSRISVVVVVTAIYQEQQLNTHKVVERRRRKELARWDKKPKRRPMTHELTILPRKENQHL